MAIEAADEGRLKEVMERVREKVGENGIAKALHTYGTAVLVNIINENYILPTRNFQTTYFPTAEKVSGEEIARSILKRPKGCCGCIIQCARVHEMRGESGEGPEYETDWAFGADCGIDDLEAIVQANNLCNEYGLDTISAGATIACLMELAERGYVQSPVRFGDASGMCLFSSFALNADDYANLLSAATGSSLDAAGLLRCGERRWNLHKLFNCSRGFGRNDDTLPYRLLRDPLQKGGPRGQVWRRDELLDEYYRIRGWDSSGNPTSEKLKELGLA